MEVDPSLDQPQRFVSRRWVHPFSAQPKEHTQLGFLQQHLNFLLHPHHLILCPLLDGSMRSTSGASISISSYSFNLTLSRLLRRPFPRCFASCLLRLQLFDLSDHPSTQTCTSLSPIHQDQIAYLIRSSDGSLISRGGGSLRRFSTSEYRDGDRLLSALKTKFASRHF